MDFPDLPDERSSDSSFTDAGPSSSSTSQSSVTDESDPSPVPLLDYKRKVLVPKRYVSPLSSPSAPKRVRHNTRRSNWEAMEQLRLRLQADGQELIWPDDQADASSHVMDEHWVERQADPMLGVIFDKPKRDLLDRATIKGVLKKDGETKEAPKNVRFWSNPRLGKNGDPLQVQEEIDDQGDSRAEVEIEHENEPNNLAGETDVGQHPRNNDEPLNSQTMNSNESSSGESGSDEEGEKKEGSAVENAPRYLLRTKRTTDPKSTPRSDDRPCSPESRKSNTSEKVLARQVRHLSPWPSKIYGRSLTLEELSVIAGVVRDGYPSTLTDSWVPKIRRALVPATTAYGKEEALPVRRPLRCSFLNEIAKILQSNGFENPLTPRQKESISLMLNFEIDSYDEARRPANFLVWHRTISLGDGRRTQSGFTSRPLTDQDKDSVQSENFESTGTIQDETESIKGTAHEKGTNVCDANKRWTSSKPAPANPPATSDWFRRHLPTPPPPFEGLSFSGRNQMPDISRPHPLTPRQAIACFHYMNEYIHKLSVQYFGYEMPLANQEAFSLAKLQDQMPQLMSYVMFIAEGSQYTWERLFTDKLFRVPLIAGVLTCAMERWVFDQTMFGISKEDDEWLLAKEIEGLEELDGTLPSVAVALMWLYG